MITEISDEDSDYTDLEHANNVIDEQTNRMNEDDAEEENEHIPKHRTNKTLKSDLGAYWQPASRT